MGKSKEIMDGDDIDFCILSNLYTWYKASHVLIESFTSMYQFLDFVKHDHMYHFALRKQQQVDQNSITLRNNSGWSSSSKQSLYTKNLTQRTHLQNMTSSNVRPLKVKIPETTT